jgi:hypothetical protein
MDFQNLIVEGFGRVRQHFLQLGPDGLTEVRKNAGNEMALRADIDTQAYRSYGQNELLPIIVAANRTIAEAMVSLLK